MRTNRRKMMNSKVDLKVEYYSNRVADHSNRLDSAIKNKGFCIMIAREIYQFFRYRLERFEFEDVVRYSLVITIGWLVKRCLE